MTEMNVFWFCLGAIGTAIGHWVWRRSRLANSKAQVRTQVIEQEIERLTEQLHQTELAYYLATEASQLKGGFLARTSHELRSPLNGMIGMHQLILADLTDGPEEEREFVAQANASALKLVKLLDDVIDVARVEHGTSKLEMQPVQLAKLLEEVHRLTYLQAKNRNLQLQVAAVPADLYLQTDPQRLRQVFVSLIDSAIAHTDEGSVMLDVQSVTQGNCTIQIQTPLLPEVWLNDRGQPLQTHDKVAALDKATVLAEANRPFPTPSFAYAVGRSLLQAMQGRLEVITRGDVPNSAQIYCVIPVVTQEASID